MVKMLMIMHRIALCTPCIALVNCDHHFAYALDHAELKTEIQAMQVQWRIRGPQASSGEDTNLMLDQGKPRCIPPKSLSFIFDFFNTICTKVPVFYI
jgi:hypothetical protein